MESSITERENLTFVVLSSPDEVVSVVVETVKTVERRSCPKTCTSRFPK